MTFPSAIIDRLRQVWSDNGYDLHNLFFAIGPYHTQQPLFSLQQGLETGAMQLADSTYNVTVVRGSQMISPQTLQHNGLYDQGGTPRSITVRSRDRRVTLTLRLTVSEAVRTPMALISRKSQVTSRKSQVTQSPVTQSRKLEPASFCTRTTLIAKSPRRLRSGRFR